MPRGRFPTVMVAVTVFVRGATTLMLLPTSFETQSCGSRTGAGDALARQSAASVAARSGTVRSIIENGLIGMDRPIEPADRVPAPDAPQDRDRKSTRLNSSHSSISYAVFCLKKKK